MDEDVTLTKRTSAKTTQQVVLCGLHTCPVTLTSVRDREWYPVARKRAFEGFVIALSGNRVQVGNYRWRRPCTLGQPSGLEVSLQISGIAA